MMMMMRMIPVFYRFCVSLAVAASRRCVTDGKDGEKKEITSGMRTAANKRKARSPLHGAAVSAARRSGYNGATEQICSARTTSRRMT